MRINFGDAPPETIKGSDEEGDLNEFPIYVICMSPDASSSLEYALDAIPEDKKEDLVFLQRGDMIEPTLKKRGLARERQTQAVLYYGLNEFGKIEDDRCALGRTPWASRSSRPRVASPESGAVACCRSRAGFFCAEFFHRDWRRQMIEAVVFESTYNLVGAVHKHVPVSEVHEFFGGEVDDMLYEIQRGLRGHLAVTLLSGFEERMAAYAAAQKRSKTDNRTIELFRVVVPYRNARAFYAISTDAQQGVPTRRRRTQNTGSSRAGTAARVPTWRAASARAVHGVARETRMIKLFTGTVRGSEPAVVRHEPVGQREVDRQQTRDRPDQCLFFARTFRRIALSVRRASRATRRVSPARSADCSSCSRWRRSWPSVRFPISSVSSFVWMESPRRDVVLSSFSQDGAKASSSAIRAFVRSCCWCSGISKSVPRARRTPRRSFG